MANELEPIWIHYHTSGVFYDLVTLHSGDLCISTYKNTFNSGGYSEHVNELWIVDEDTGRVKERVQLSEPTGWSITSLTLTPLGDVLVLLKHRGDDKSKLDRYSSDGLRRIASIQFGHHYSTFISSTNETAHILEWGDQIGGEDDEPQWQKFAAISLSSGEFLEQWPPFDNGIQDYAVVGENVYVLLNSPQSQPLLNAYALEDNGMSFLRGRVLELPGERLAVSGSTFVAMGNTFSGSKLISVGRDQAYEWQDSITGKPSGLLHHEKSVYLTSTIVGENDVPRTLLSKYLAKSGHIIYSKEVDGEASGLMAANKRFLVMAITAPKSDDMHRRNQILGLDIATGNEVFRIATLNVLASNLILQDSKVLFMSVRAIGVADLYKRWSVKIGSSMRVKPAVDAQVISFTTASGEVRCLDSTTGRDIWVVRGEPQSQLKPVLNDVSVIAAMGNQLLVLDRETGRELWRHQTDSSITVDLSLSGPESEILTLGTSDGSVMVFDAVTGELLSHPLLKFLGNISTSILSQANQVVIGFKSGYVLVTTWDGTAQWFLPQSIHEICGLAYHSNKIIVVDGGGTVSALSSAAGEDLWSLRLDGSVYGREIAFIDENRLTLVDSKGVVYVIDARDGAIMWRSNPLGKNMSLPTIVEKGLLSISREGATFILDPSNGSVLDSFHLANTLASPVGSKSNVVVFADEGGNLHRLLL